MYQFTKILDSGWSDVLSLLSPSQPFNFDEKISFEILGLPLLQGEDLKACMALDNKSNFLDMGHTTNFSL